MEPENDVLLARERAARIQAETAARARDEFLALVSHELRAPLNGIQCWSHIIESHVKNSDGAPLLQRAVNGIRTGISQQVRLIEDLLDVTRMLSGKLRLVVQPFAMLPVIQSAVESVQEAADAKGISISSDYRIMDEQTEGDPSRIQQAFCNLLSNAVKFTQTDGNIWVTAAVNGDRMAITIRDDGVGISPEFLPHLFDRFSQQDTSTTRGHSGLGLGLFLARHLIDLHGGTVTAESPGPGKGAQFTVTLAIRTDHVRERVPAMPGSKSVSADDAALAGVNIMLIDDQEEARESLLHVLEGAGANVLAACCAAEALERIANGVGMIAPDILVCDIAMPGEDGYAALRRLRGWKTDGGLAPLQHVPALALTAFSQREDRIRALTAGFGMHMAKPVAPEELIVVIATMLSRNVPEPHGT
jgi:CheY-like chemotaxis protein